MQTKANAELTIKFKQVHQIHFQYESVYSFFLDISQIESFQILDTITTFAWREKLQAYYTVPRHLLRSFRIVF